MTITKEFGSYNQRRYSRPWIARVSAWPVGGRAELAWGTYLGDDTGGTVEIEASEGDVIRYGQKDNRGNGGSANWAIVQADGSFTDCKEANAAKAFRAKNVVA